MNPFKMALRDVGKEVKLINLIILILLFFVDCKKDKDGNGNLVVHFMHEVDGKSLEIDTLIYINAAGNPYLINEIQYFISDVTLYKSDGSIILIDDRKAIHYIDTDLPETHIWEVFDDICSGQYDSICFTFGISQEKNKSLMFVNPPESYMFWPEYLGGGYHYMKFNGKWLEEGQPTETTPFNCHIGMGQIYYSFPDSITGFIPNDFQVSLPGSSFEMPDGGKKQIYLTMNIEKWFKEPHIYDLDVIGGSIMQNQEAMQKLKENGRNVFSVKIE